MALLLVGMEGIHPFLKCREAEAGLSLRMLEDVSSGLTFPCGHDRSLPFVTQVC